ncbi:hypothetical protein O181_009149 [Austropuccinia psidii MF-1]|uniref:Uncharacterized protein n=1 Tax=Austropuccinia psidii MF-1 TaxID=1389203 RepID=A0A9Q3GJJ8_9BASI|nr:hypothetical protein [Austropuccinia psidii MF-1]
MPELPPVPKGNNRELVYGSQTETMGTPPKSLDRHLELISSSEEVHGARKDRRTSEGLYTHFLQRKSPTDKSLVEKPKHVIRGPEEEVGPWEKKKAPQASKGAKQAQASPKYQPEGKEKGKGKKSPSGTSLTSRITGFLSACDSNPKNKHDSQIP